MGYWTRGKAHVIHDTPDSSKWNDWGRPMIVQHILTANQLPNVRKAGGYRDWVALQLALRWPGATPDWSPAGDPVPAHIVRSYWVVKCPDCPDQLVYEPGQPFYCLTCQNVGNAGKARPVQMPANRAHIEALLKGRPNPHTRNWLGEDAATLRLENIAHGVVT